MQAHICCSTYTAFACVRVVCLVVSLKLTHTHTRTHTHAYRFEIGGKWRSKYGGDDTSTAVTLPSKLRLYFANIASDVAADTWIDDVSVQTPLGLSSTFICAVVCVCVSTCVYVCFCVVCVCVCVYVCSCACVVVPVLCLGLLALQSHLLTHTFLSTNTHTHTHTLSPLVTPCHTLSHRLREHRGGVAWASKLQRHGHCESSKHVFPTR
jgi:hypothetical protein